MRKYLFKTFFKIKLTKLCNNVFTGEKSLVLKSRNLTLKSNWEYITYKSNTNYGIHTANVVSILLCKILQLRCSLPSKRTIKWRMFQSQPLKRTFFKDVSPSCNRNDYFQCFDEGWNNCLNVSATIWCIARVWTDICWWFLCFLCWLNMVCFWGSFHHLGFLGMF